MAPGNDSQIRHPVHHCRRRKLPIDRPFRTCRIACRTGRQRNVRGHNHSATPADQSRAAGMKLSGRPPPSCTPEHDLRARCDFVSVNFPGATTSNVCQRRARCVADLVVVHRTQ